MGRAPPYAAQSPVCCPEPLQVLGAWRGQADDILSRLYLTWESVLREHPGLVHTVRG